jgi:methanogenic corrinoid protein MtbC1
MDGGKLMNHFLPLQQRIRIAQRIRGTRDNLATRINEEFFRRHPDWKERYGERGVRLGFEDACFHLDFLSSAIEVGTASSFAEYVMWARRMLEARGIAAAFLEENLRQVGSAASTLLEPTEQECVAEFIAAGVLACEGTLPALNAPEPAVNVFVHALLAGNRNAALNVAKEFLAQGQTVPDVYLEVLQPAMYEIGRLWEANQIMVAREHMATAITQYVMGQLFPLLLQASRPTRGTAVVAGVQGELHQLGALMVSDVLEGDGRQVRFLGSNMPHSGIIDAIKQEQATLLGISTTILFNVPKALELIQSVRDTFSGVRVLVGGAAFKSADLLWKEVAADAFVPDLIGAVSAARQISGGHLQ